MAQSTSGSGSHFTRPRRKLIGSKAPSRCSSGKSCNSIRPFDSTRFTTNVRSSRDRPGITSARKVTFISGRAHTRTFRDLSDPFDRLKIPIFYIFVDLLLVLCLSVSRMNFGFRTFGSELLCRRCRGFADAVEDRAFDFLPTLFRHASYHSKTSTIQGSHSHDFD